MINNGLGSNCFVMLNFFEVNDFVNVYFKLKVIEVSIVFEFVFVIED